MHRNHPLAVIVAGGAAGFAAVFTAAYALTAFLFRLWDDNQGTPVADPINLDMEMRA